jgi:hypothetical protein
MNTSQKNYDAYENTILKRGDICKQPLKVEFAKVFYAMPICFFCGILAGISIAMMVK